MRHARGITAALVVEGCAIGVGAAWPLVSGDAEPDAADVTGVWTSPRGGRLEFSGDGRVTAGNITLAPACDPDGVRPEGARVSGTGRWTIGAVPDEAPGAVIDFRPADGPGGDVPPAGRRRGRGLRAPHGAGLRTGPGERLRGDAHRASPLRPFRAAACAVRRSPTPAAVPAR